MGAVQEKIIRFVNMNGPILPVKISKAVDISITFAGAYLSELVKNKAILITTAKIGSSPLYYVSGQEFKLQMLENHLNNREKDAFRLLRDKKVIRDIKAEPVQRVALRQIKDFAFPITVNHEGQTELFWKWYLVSDGEAEKLIKDMMGIKEEVKEVKQEVLEVKEKIIEPKKEIEKQEVLGVKEVKPKVRKVRVKKEVITNVYDEVVNYLKKKKISIKEQELIKKNKEFEFIVDISSNVGKLKYFVKFKDKKKINEGDLSLAYHKGQNKKMPVMFLSKGELTKKANEYLEKELKGQLTFRQIS